MSFSQGLKAQGPKGLIAAGANWRNGARRARKRVVWLILEGLRGAADGVWVT